MKKFCLLAIVVSILLLMVNISLAQTPREPSYNSEGKTVFTDLAATGLNVDGTSEQNPGVPAYVELINGRGNVYYIYIDMDGILRIASATKVGYLASPATVGWQAASGVPVATQIGVDSRTW